MTPRTSRPWADTATSRWLWRYWRSANRDHRWSPAAKLGSASDRWGNVGAGTTIGGFSRVAVTGEISARFQHARPCRQSPSAFRRAQHRILVAHLGKCHGGDGRLVTLARIQNRFAFGIVVFPITAIQVRFGESRFEVGSGRLGGVPVFPLASQAAQAPERPDVPNRAAIRSL